MKKIYQLKESRVIHRGYIFDIVRDRFLYKASGRMMSRDLVVHRGAVAIVPYLDRHHLILLRQFRYAAKGNLWEIPAGTLEKGEKVITCAKRELEEETGYRAACFRRLTSFYSAPGMTNEIMTLYRADQLTLGKKELDHDEVITHRVVRVKEALKMIRQGKIRDAKSIVGILWSLLD